MADKKDNWTDWRNTWWSVPLAVMGLVGIGIAAVGSSSGNPRMKAKEAAIIGSIVYGVVTVVSLFAFPPLGLAMLGLAASAFVLGGLYSLIRLGISTLADALTGKADNKSESRNNEEEPKNERGNEVQNRNGHRVSSTCNMVNRGLTPQMDIRRKQHHHH